MLRIKEISQNQGFHIAVSRKHVGHIGGVTGVQIAQIKVFNSIFKKFHFKLGKQVAAIRLRIHFRSLIADRGNVDGLSICGCIQADPAIAQGAVFNISLSRHSVRKILPLTQFDGDGGGTGTGRHKQLLQAIPHLIPVEDVVIRGKRRGEVALLTRLVDEGVCLVGRLVRIEPCTVAANQQAIGTAIKHVPRGISRNERFTTPFAWVVIIFHLSKNEFLAGVNGCQFLALAEHAPCIKDLGRIKV